MEKLLVYILLEAVGFDTYHLYKNTLYEMLENDAQNNIMLDLAGRDHKDTVLHMLSVLKKGRFDKELFGKELMNELLKIYRGCEINDFAKRMYRLWTYLPSSMCEEDPFFFFLYADEPLLYGDQKHSRELYEEALNYYSGV